MGYSFKASGLPKGPWGGGSKGKITSLDLSETANKTSTIATRCPYPQPWQSSVCQTQHPPTKPKNDRHNTILLNRTQNIHTHNQSIAHCRQTQCPWSLHHHTSHHPPRIDFHHQALPGTEFLKAMPCTFVYQIFIRSKVGNQPTLT